MLIAALLGHLLCPTSELNSSPREGEVAFCEPERAKKTEGVYPSQRLTPSASFLGTSPSRGEQFDGDSFEGAKTLDRILSRLSPGAARQPIGDLVARIGLELRGKPYVGWTLERDMDTESCYVSLDRLDCVTFFESALAIARGVKTGKTSPADIVNTVTTTRYWGGNSPKLYTDRIHYTSDWIFDNERKGIVQDVCRTSKLASRFIVPLHFMSLHASTYAKLKAHPELIEGIKKTEEASNRRIKYFFAKSSLDQASAELKTGDIIGITCTTPGMDCAHTGMIVVEKDGPHFLHASSVQKKVVLDDLIQNIINGNKKYTGIMVARPLEP